MISELFSGTWSLSLSLSLSTTSSLLVSPTALKKGERRKKQKGLLLLFFSFPLDPFILLSLASFVPPPFARVFSVYFTLRSHGIFLSECSVVFFLRSCSLRLFSFFHHELVHNSQKQYQCPIIFVRTCQLYCPAQEISSGKKRQKNPHQKYFYINQIYGYITEMPSFASCPATILQ